HGGREPGAGVADKDDQPALRQDYLRVAIDPGAGRQGHVGVVDAETAVVRDGDGHGLAGGLAHGVPPGAAVGLDGAVGGLPRIDRRSGGGVHVETAVELDVLHAVHIPDVDGAAVAAGHAGDL